MDAAEHAIDAGTSGFARRRQREKSRRCYADARRTRHSRGFPIVSACGSLTVPPTWCDKPPNARSSAHGTFAKSRAPNRKSDPKSSRLRAGTIRSRVIYFQTQPSPLTRPLSAELLRARTRANTQPLEAQWNPPSTSATTFSAGPQARLLGAMRMDRDIGKSTQPTENGQVMIARAATQTEAWALAIRMADRSVGRGET